MCDSDNEKQNMNEMEVNGNEETVSTTADVKPNDNEEDPNKKVVSIEVEYQGNTVQFKIKYNTQFTKLFKVYCERMNFDRNVVRFLLDDVRVLPDSTPKDHDMQNGDVLSVFLEQNGGFKDGE